MRARTPAPPKMKNTEDPRGCSFLNSAPCEQQSPRLWHYVLVTASRNARGATFAASLTSKLADSALLGYLRRSLQRKLRRKSRQISHSAEKEKHGRPERGCSVFLAEKERFELSRRYSRPTPLAGAPLHHLSTSPKKVSVNLTCHNIIPSFFRIVNTFFKDFSEKWGIDCHVFKK